MEPIAQAQHTARALINDARVRRIGNGHGYWCFLNSAQSARRRAAAPGQPPLTAVSKQRELFA
jgi:hypothetical protein